MFSGGAGTSLQNTGNILTVSSLPVASEASLASSTTPTKTTLDGSGPDDIPQSKMNNTHAQDKTLVVVADAPGNFSTKTQKSTKKRSRPSPSMKVAKKLFTGEEAADGSGGSILGEEAADGNGGAATSDQNSPSKDA